MYRCQLIDVSPEGVRLKVDAKLSPGDIVDVISGEGRLHTTPCRIVWVGKPGTEQDGEAGLQLLNPFSESS